MDIQEAVNLARRGDAIAFLGSGFSFGAKNTEGDSIPSSTDLNKIISVRIGVGSDTDVQVAAELFEEEFGATELRRLILAKFSTKEVSPWHKIVMSVPWRRMYTTNYDDVAEFAAEQEKSRLVSVTINDAPDRQGAGLRVLVHLHGSVLPYTKNQGAEGSFQLSAASYYASKFPSSAWAPTMRNDFNFSRAIFFIGYSLSDFDIARLIFDDADLRQKTFMVCKPGVTEVEKRRLAKFGNVLPVGIEEFARALANVDPSTLIQSTPSFVSFREIIPPTQPKVPSQDDYVDLLTTGRFGSDVYAFAQSGGAKYATPRRALADLRMNEAARRIVVHAGLGNGKSLFLQQAAQDYIARGFRVFEFVRRTEMFSSEIASIVKGGERVCLMFDNLFVYRDIISFAHSHLTRDDIIVATCRTLQYELNNGEVESILGKDFLEIDLNVLTFQELEYTSQAFTSYGLWGRENYLPENKKNHYLAEKCDSEIRSIVLFAFGSGPISAKIKAWASAIETESNSQVKRFVMSCVVLSLVHADVSFLDLCDILECRPHDIKKALHSSDASDLVMSLDGRRVGVRSAILALHMASQSFEPESVLHTLTTLVRKLTDWLHSGKWAQEILRELMRFAIVGRLFETSERREFIVAFYESIRDVEYCRRNPQFWLQYAMARIDREEYPLAEKLLGMAESRASELASYNTFQIDNQRARFLLLSRARSSQYADYQKAYIEASRLIFKQMKGSQLVTDPYPLRLILANEEFISSRIENLDSVIRSTCTSVLREFGKRLEKWPASYRENERREWTASLERTQEYLSNAKPA